MSEASKFDVKFMCFLCFMNMGLKSHVCGFHVLWMYVGFVFDVGGFDI